MTLSYFGNANWALLDSKAEMSYCMVCVILNFLPVVLDFILSYYLLWLSYWSFQFQLIIDMLLQYILCTKFYFLNLRLFKSHSSSCSKSFFAASEVNTNSFCPFWWAVALMALPLTRWGCCTGSCLFLLPFDFLPWAFELLASSCASISGWLAETWFSDAGWISGVSEDDSDSDNLGWAGS